MILFTIKKEAIHRVGCREVWLEFQKYGRDSVVFNLCRCLMVATWNPMNHGIQIAGRNLNTLGAGATIPGRLVSDVRTR